LSAFKAYKNFKKIYKVLKVETKIATDSITVDRERTPLNTASIAL
jgi:hypothetical protein